MTKWTQQQAIDLCRKIEAVCPPFGCHVALTGGALYKDGERKDADILFYRIRQVEHIDVDGLMIALAEIGVTPGPDHGWVYKATHEGRAIDFFFPERPGLEYPRCDPADMPQSDAEFGFTKDWCLNMAAKEGDAEVGAGLIAVDP